MIPKKQSTTQDQWLNTLKNIQEIISEKHIDSLVNKTIKEIKRIVQGKRVACCWSGGKDSLALQKICDLVGIKRSVLVVSNLEYPSFIKWVSINKPENLEIINTGQDLKWLAKNENMLFPQESKTAGKWFQIVQHKGQEIYFKDNNLDILLLGRRRADGNYTGKAGQNIYTNRKGITRYSPLRDWTHEEILRLLSCYKISLPPIYFCHNGFKVGTGAWPARQWTSSINGGYKEVYDIDKKIVFSAAEYLKSARDFINKGGF